MKGLSETIIIVVTAVVILVAALVILTIFGGGVGTVSTLTNFRTQCITQCQMTCKMGALPPTWSIPVKVQGITGDTTCKAQVDNLDSCGGACGTAPSTGGGITPTGTCTPPQKPCGTKTDNTVMCCNP